MGFGAVDDADLGDDHKLVGCVGGPPPIDGTTRSAFGGDVSFPAQHGIAVPAASVGFGFAVAAPVGAAAATVLGVGVRIAVSAVAGIAVAAPVVIAAPAVPVVGLWAAGGVGGVGGGVVDGGQGVAVGDDLKKAVGEALAVVADSAGRCVASAVETPQGVVVVLECLAHQREADRVELGVQHTHPAGLIDKQRPTALAALTAQLALSSGGVVAGRELLGLVAQRLRRHHRGGFEQLGCGVDRVGAGAPRSVGEHSRVLDVQLAHRQAPSHVGHLGDLLADLDGAPGVALAHTRPADQRRAARTRTRGFERGGRCEQHCVCG